MCSASDRTQHTAAICWGRHWYSSSHGVGGTWMFSSQLRVILVKGAWLRWMLRLGEQQSLQSTSIDCLHVALRAGRWGWGHHVQNSHLKVYDTLPTRSSCKKCGQGTVNVSRANKRLSRCSIWIPALNFTGKYVCICWTYSMISNQFYASVVLRVVPITSHVLLATWCN